MARIRSIKPELLEDEKTASLSDTEWRLFVSCILMADDYGNFRAAPAKLAGSAFWGSPQSLDVVTKALARLASVGLLRVYELGGQAYAHLNGWDKHQRVDKPGKPQCPMPPGNDSRDIREDSEKAPETLAPDQDQEDEKEDERESARAPQSREESPSRSSEPKKGTVYWLRRIFRGKWEARYGTGFFSESRGEQTAWDRHLRDNPSPAYQAKLFDDMPEIIPKYLADSDAVLAAKKHPLAFLPERIPQYRAIAAPPSTRTPAFSAAKQHALR